MDTDKKIELEDFRKRVYERHLVEFDRVGNSSDMVIFAHEKLSELTDWENVLQSKIEQFEDRLSIAPKSQHQSIYNIEFLESNEQYDPETNFCFRSIAYYLIVQGLNWDIRQILEKWPTFCSWDSPNNLFEHFNFPFEGKEMSCFVVDSDFLHYSVADGISQVHYREYLKDRRRDFYPEEFSVDKNENETISPRLENIEWKGTTTELCELIYALWKSNKIYFKTKPIQQKELINLFTSMLNKDLSNFHDLVREAKISNKSNEGIFFMKELLTLIENNYIEGK